MAAEPEDSGTASRCNCHLEGLCCTEHTRLIASFLSKRREFLGRPDDVKRILLDNCTGLGRQRNMQGAGMPNLVKMLVNV